MQLAAGWCQTLHHKKCPLLPTQKNTPLTSVAFMNHILRNEIGSQPHPERRPDDILSPEYTLDSFRHLGCSLTVDCLPAGISFEDLGVQVTPEIADMKPSSVFAHLEIDPTMFPESSVIEDVKDAFSQRAATW